VTAAAAEAEDRLAAVQRELESKERELDEVIAMCVQSKVRPLGCSVRRKTVRSESSETYVRSYASLT